MLMALLERRSGYRKQKYNHVVVEVIKFDKKQQISCDLIMLGEENNLTT